MAAVAPAHVAVGPDGRGHPAVHLRNVGMCFRSRQQDVVALENITLSVQPGEFVSLIGPSGCGKSTVLRIVADIVQATSGEVSVTGLTPLEARIAHRYSFVFQEPVLLPWRTVWQNVALPLELEGVDKADRRRVADQSLQIVQLDGFGDMFPHELSGGMRMRASLARALTRNPPLLLMDEPFGALDEITRLQMNQELLRVWEHTNAAVLFVTHSIEEAVLMSDRVFVLSPRPGKISSVVPVDLPRPREHAELLKTPAFTRIITDVRRALYHA